MFSIFSSFWSGNSNNNGWKKKIAIESAQTAQDLAEMSLQKVQTADVGMSELSADLAQQVKREHSTWKLLAKAGLVLGVSTGVYAACRLAGLGNTISGAMGHWFSSRGLGYRNGSEAIAIDIGANNIHDIQLVKTGAQEGAEYIAPTAIISQAVWQSPINVGSLNGITGFMLDGEEAGDNSGYSVSYAGDVNGDRVDDIIIGAWLASPEDRYYAGRSYLVFGHNGTWSNYFDLATLNGTYGFKIDGEEAGDWSGCAASYAGDINGDRFDDIIIGAPDASSENRTYVGRSYVVFGHNGVWLSSLDLTTLDGIKGFRLDGESAGDESGGAVSYAGDVNGDRIDDVIIGVPAASPDNRLQAGRSYVVFGRNGIWLSSLDLTTLDGIKGFRLDGESAGDGSGVAVSYAGDVNGDQFDDLIISALYASPVGKYQAGRSYVVFGHNDTWPNIFDLTTLNGVNGFKLDGEVNLDHSGDAVGYVGDINGDYVDDFSIGAPMAYSEGGPQAGRSYVIFGHKGIWASPINLATLNGTNGFILDGEKAVDFSGWPLSSAGDVNGDRIDDIGVSAIFASPEGKASAGRGYVVFGHKGSWDSPFSLTKLNGANGFKLDGENEGVQNGWFAQYSGDINGDRISDIFVSAAGESPGNRTGAGRSYIIFGDIISRFGLQTGTLLPSQAGCCAIGIGQSYNFTFVADSFTNVLGTITYKATLIDDAPLPVWLNFSPENRMFFGTALNASDMGSLQIKVAANINLATISQTFTLNIAQSLEALNIAKFISYTENENYTLASIVIVTPSSTVVTELTLSDPTAGILRIASSGNVTATYNTTTGVWSASGAKDDVNALLASLMFQPALNAYKKFDINLNIVDSYGQSISATINVFGHQTPSQAPLIGGLVGGLGSAALIGVGAAYAVYRRKRMREKQLEIILSSPKPWNFDVSLKPSQSEVKNYHLIPAGESDMAKVVEAYQRCPVPGMELKNVKIIYSRSLEQGFVARLEMLQNKEGNPAFIPKWGQENKIALRAAVADSMRQKTEAYKDEQYPAVKLMPAWYGVNPEILGSLYKTGFVSTDGLFGKGIYCAYEARRAYQDFGEGQLLMNWVAFYLAYPVIDGDVDRLQGKGNYANYDVHFAPVREAINEQQQRIFTPCRKIEEAVYHEVVVFGAAQCLPRYLVELQPSLTPAVSPALTPVAEVEVAAAVAEDAGASTVSVAAASAPDEDNGQTAAAAVLAQAKGVDAQEPEAAQKAGFGSQQDVSELPLNPPSSSNPRGFFAHPGGGRRAYRVIAEAEVGVGAAGAAETAGASTQCLNY